MASSHLFRSGRAYENVNRCHLFTKMFENVRAESQCLLGQGTQVLELNNLRLPTDIWHTHCSISVNKLLSACRPT